MEKPDLTGLVQTVADKITPLIEELLAQHAQNIHSLHIVGSAVMPDYDEKRSDVNSVIVLHDMDLKFIAFLAPLGKKFGKKRIAAPLVMTPAYIGKSLDAFPIEFLNFQLMHKTVFGEDLFKDLMIEKHALRLQCEREIKVKLMGLRQGYLSSLGRKEHLAEVLVRSITGIMPFFRSLIFLLGSAPPLPRVEVIKAFGATTGIATETLEKLLLLKNGASKPSEQELHALFELYYQALESLEKIIDDHHV